MDREKILDYLSKASVNKSQDLPPDNIFRQIGFDEGRPRLGWFFPPDFKGVEEAVTSFLEIAKGRDEFIFVGMGGSVNGVKALINLTQTDYIHALDSLDTEAIDDVLSRVRDFNRTLVCLISKSGTTKETRLIAESLRSVWGPNFTESLLWITDPGSYGKLDSLGWKGTKKIPIQVNRKEDIGGRFSSPHTLVFLAPLVLIFEKNIYRLRDFWRNYISLRNNLLDEAFNLADNLSGLGCGKFQVEVKTKTLEGIDNWIIQLFQESLGSKKEDFSVKTVVSRDGKAIAGFNKISLDLDIKDPLLYAACLMHYLQVFVALFSYSKEINFVNQPYVEIYKKELKDLEDKTIESQEPVDLDRLADIVSDALRPEQEFIDIILYFNSTSAFRNKLLKVLSKKFKDRIISIFTGSDWNHHSYQAAFKDKNTLFAILTSNKYNEWSKFIPEGLIIINIKMLRAISYATYKTLQDKALYLSI